MKPRNTLISLKKFQLAEKIRKVAQIEAMIADFRRIANDLELEIAAEEARAGINDPSHFAYPTYAKAAMTRRENLKRSADDLALQLEGTKAALQESFDELKKAELLDERDQDRHAPGEAGEAAALATGGTIRARSAIA